MADRVWVARYEWFDVNVTLVGGARGLLVVDTHGVGRRGRAAVVDDVRRLGVGDGDGVVNTHEHFDHTFGNAAFREAYGDVPIHAHEAAAERTVAAGERIKERSTPPTRTTRTATRCWRPRSCLPTTPSPPPSRSTSATGWSSWSTPAAATPAATSWSGCPTPTCCSPATWSRSPAPRSFGDDC